MRRRGPALRSSSLHSHFRSILNARLRAIAKVRRLSVSDKLWCKLIIFYCRIEESA